MTSSVDKLTITAPDDWHIHLRDGAALKTTVAHAASNFRRAIVMPNLVPPVKSADQALAYRDRIRAAVPSGLRFEPLMVLYLTDNTSADDIREAHSAGVIACKLYPAGATTNSDSGVTRLAAIYPALETMQTLGIKLLVHGEVTHGEVDIFDREARFIDEVLLKIVRDFPQLRVVFEHITTADAVDFVAAAGEHVGATITAHHLLFNRNHLLSGGIRPHYYCLPVLKRRRHQEALIKAATGGEKRYFLGTDSAPHAKNTKEAACGCAGAYTAYAPMSLYAEVFDRVGRLDRLEAFASFHGPDFYGLPRNPERVELWREDWTMPVEFPLADKDTLVPLLAGETLHWRVKAC